MKLLVDDVEVILGAEFQGKLVDCIPDSRVYIGLLHILAKSNDADIRCDVAYKDNISEKTAMLLLEDKDPRVLDRILSNRKAKSVITLNQIKEIIENAGSELIRTIIFSIDDFTQIDPFEIADLIYKLNEPYAHLALADNWDTPKGIMKKLAESDDPDIQNCAKNNLDR